jgi:hypothetical protein
MAVPALEWRAGWLVRRRERFDQQGKNVFQQAAELGLEGRG